MIQFLNQIIKNIFNACGLEIHRRIKKVGRRTTMAEVLSHVLRIGFMPSTVIDVGAAEGTFCLYEKFPEANHLLIEPLKEFEKALKKICLKYKAEYVVAAAGAKSGKTMINVHPDLLGSSIFKETDGGYADGIPRQIPVVTIDDLCTKRDLRGPYLIKIDVQDAECEVLDGAKKVLEDTELILLEVSLFQFHINGPQLYDLVNYMKNQGFVVYDIFGGSTRPLDDALASVDMAFVKENGRFRKHHFYALREQRENLTKQLHPKL